MTEPTDIEKMSARRKGVPSGLLLAERIRGGATVVELAAEFNVSKSTVARAVNDAGLSSADGRSTVQVRSERIPIVAFPHMGYDPELEDSACYQHPTLPPDAWFPSTQGEQRLFEDAAKAVCRSCPVALRCLERALDEEANAERHGIRGALNEAERAALSESGAA